ncbi:MAG TPA: hypothetical protein VJV23_04535, partial [Candidatus Polarisedimenticolia bacterium]|nr:hypothetical protein [Candidatus Polarisedimenticolia bacterium]
MEITLTAAAGGPRAARAPAEVAEALRAAPAGGEVRIRIEGRFRASPGGAPAPLEAWQADRWMTRALSALHRR